MHTYRKNVLLLALPFAGTAIPSIQLPILEGYLKERGIDVMARHLYLKAAEFYGLKNYHFLIEPPNDSYNAQMVFSRYVFPEHWDQNSELFREYFNTIISKNKDLQHQFTFADYVERTNKFYEWVIEHTDWKSYDFIGFTLNYGQFLPSLAIAKKIKDNNPDKKIIFGGSRTVNKLGINVLKAFGYVDFIVSGDGEEALYRLASNDHPYESIPHLIYRDGEEIIWNKSDAYVDLNNLPIPSYDAFYEELFSVSEELRQYFYFYGRLPIEIVRGCWWNNCTFCNQKILHPKYREKSVDRIVEEIKFLSGRYKMLTFQVIGDTLLKTDYKLLLEKIIQLDRDFTFFAEVRAGQLKNEEYHLLKQAGFTTIQTGIEAFSHNYLRKMNKGVRLIDNIALLKFCMENGLTNRYNIIVGYPNEESIDFEETKKHIRLFKQFLDPPQISKLIVEFGSAIYTTPEMFNIKRLAFTKIDEIMFPKEYLEKNCSFFYSFKAEQEIGIGSWETLVEEWKKERDQLTITGIKTQTAIDKFIFYFVDGGDFLKIYDKRNAGDIKLYILDGLERNIFLACSDVISLGELRNKFYNIPEHELLTVLKKFDDCGIVFRENDYYLSLPLCYCLASHRSANEKQPCVVYSSGMHRSL